MSRLNSFLLAFNAICFLVILSILLPSCGGGGGLGQTNIPVNPTIDPSSITIPAANVLFRPLNAAQTREDGVNTDIKIYADQVELDNSKTSLQATNVQGAFDETQPDLATILPGTWKTVNYSNGNKIEGTLTFNADGTLSSDSNGKGYICLLGPEYNDITNVTYRILETDILEVAYDHYDDFVGETMHWCHYEQFPNITSNKLTISGSGFAKYLIKN